MLKIILFIALLYIIRLYFYFKKEEKHEKLKVIDLYPGKVIEYDPKTDEHPIFVKDIGFWDESGNYKEDIQPITKEDLI